MPSGDLRLVFEATLEITYSETSRRNLLRDKCCCPEPVHKVAIDLTVLGNAPLRKESSIILQVVHRTHQAGIVSPC